MADKVTIPALQQMKREGKKSVGVVAWDYQIARIADRAGVDFVSVGDFVGVNLWGHANPLEVTMDEMLVVCKAVRRGVTRALVSCDFPFGPLQEGTDSAVQRRDPPGEGRRRRHDQARWRRRLSRGGARAGARRHSGVRAVRDHAADRAEIRHPLQRAECAGAQATAEMTAKLVEEAKLLEEAGASLLDFTNSGPVAGAAVVKAVKIPVIGGFGGGPWLDGRVRLAHTAIGYAREMARLEDRDLRQCRAKRALDAFTALIDDVRAGKPDQGLDQMATAVIDGITTRYEVRGLRAAAADVCARRLRRDAGEMAHARRLRQDQAARSSAEEIHLHHLRPARDAASPAGGSSASPGRTTWRRARACSTISASSARISWAAAWAAVRWRRSASRIRRWC